MHLGHNPAFVYKIHKLLKLIWKGGFTRRPISRSEGHRKIGGVKMHIPTIRVVSRVYAFVTTHQIRALKWLSFVVYK